MKILIVDDNVEFTNIVTIYGTTLGVDVDVCSTASGVLLRESFEYDIVILDVDLPDVDGFDLFDMVRSKCPRVVILFLTGLVSKVDRMHGLGLGADGYLLKPIDMDELFLRLENILLCSGVRYVDDFRIDYRSRVITRDGVKVDLFQKGFEVFDFLLVNKDQVMSKKKILTAVWGNCLYQDPKTVEVQIRAIRMAVGDRIIITVRNRGYVYGSSFGVCVD